MATEDKGPSLTDFFKTKGKKKIKASNLNKDTTTTKTEETKKKTKATEDDAWEEEEVVGSTMKVEIAGKLMREEEEKKDEDDTAAPAWGDLRKQAKESGDGKNLGWDKKYPALQKSMISTSINIDDGSESKVNISTSKNAFSALEGDEFSDDDKPKRPKEIKPAMVSKKKGEFTKVAVERELKKYAPSKEEKKKAAKEGDEEEEDDDEEEAAEAEEEEGETAPVEEEVRKKKSPEKKEEKKDEKKDDKKAKKPAPEDDQENLAEDLKIQVDLVASKEKYKGRKKLPRVELPREEEKEEKEEKRQNNTGKKKKMCLEEETDKKLAYAPDDAWA